MSVGGLVHAILEEKVVHAVLLVIEKPVRICETTSSSAILRSAKDGREKSKGNTDRSQSR
jgi:hypothetical protein